MILGSHNSWSYLPPKKWWMKPLRFTAQCQDWDIKTQYEHGVRCFDLRLQYDGDTLRVVHGLMIYKITKDQLKKDLEWLNSKGDVYVRMVHDARTSSLYTQRAVQNFRNDCAEFVQDYPSITFWYGVNLYNNSHDYTFDNDNISCTERYSSVVLPKIDDLYPRCYAKKNNKKIYAEGTDADILLIDFVNYVV